MITKKQCHAQNNVRKIVFCRSGMIFVPERIRTHFLCYNEANVQITFKRQEEHHAGSEETYSGCNGFF